MKLEQQVTSLELSKKLKELGVKQESLYLWLYGNKESELMSGRDFNKIDVHYVNLCTSVSAYTVAELGEMLLKSPNFIKLHIYTSVDGKHWCNLPEQEAGQKKIPVLMFDSDTEANARGEVVSYLTKNNLIKT